MGASDWAAIGVAVFGVIFGVIGYLLSQKDAAQALQIQTLQVDKEKHNEKLHLLEVEIVKRIHQDEWKETMSKIFGEFKELREMFHTQDRRQL